MTAAIRRGPALAALAAAAALAAGGRAARAAEPAPVGDGVARFALILGVNRSVDPEMPVLRYADDDAVRYGELFRALGARTALLTRGDENTQRLAPRLLAHAGEPRRAELARQVAAIAAEVAAARARGVPTVLYFIYAGHGRVGGGEQAYLALEDARLSGDDIEHDVIDAVRADESHLIIDACYSYFIAYGRGPGGKRREIHDFAPKEGLARRPDVGLLLSTTSARESHEWEGFQAGVFSHEVRSGLFGAADFDGDGRVSYVEMAAFINRANSAIPNERFRPDVLARPPAGSAALVDLRGGGGRRLRVGGGRAEAGRYTIEDTRGVRLADFHNAPGHEVSMLLPADAGQLYLRRKGDDAEFVIPAEPTTGALTLAGLSQREWHGPRGAANDSFSLVFSLPFDQASFAAATTADALAARLGDTPPSPPLPRWRKVGAATAGGVAVASLIGAGLLVASARSLSAEVRDTPGQLQAAALRDRVDARNGWARALSFGAGASAAVGAALLWLLPRGDLYAGGAADGQLGMVEVGGRF
jgi:hypothetical protein